MKRREYLKEYRQKYKSKLNEYHKKYYHSKKKKNEEEKDARPFGQITGIKDDHTVDDEEIKSIDLGKNNESDNNNDSGNDSNNESNKEKKKKKNTLMYLLLQKK